jgi:methylated-DNA-[protein]-cysteine S-methyltransferase
MMSEQTYCLASAIGDVEVTWSDAGLTRVRLLGSAIGLTPASLRDVPVPPPIAHCVQRLQRYATGVAIDFSDIVLDARRVPPTVMQIYDALRRIVWGQTTTYGALARSCRDTVGPRAIGAAMARNPWPVIVPCHRVLGADGSLGGFSAPGGVDTKRRLLLLEQVEHGALAPLLPGLL